tara:strand:+ start:66 stop:437 length:372 start_codon:yes stop_codon:yes gene_type:complete
MKHITHEMDIILKMSRLSQEDSEKIINSIDTLPPVFKERVLKNISNRKYSLEYSIECDNKIENIKKIIGVNGCYLKKTTNKYNLDMIWFDQDNKYFILYGDYKGVLGAINILQSRIKKFTQYK